MVMVTPDEAAVLSSRTFSAVPTSLNITKEGDKNVADKECSDACKDAYKDCVKNCNKVLVDCLASAKNDKEKEACKERFKKCMHLCKEAKEICLEVCKG